MSVYTESELAEARRYGNTIASASPDGVAFMEWLAGPNGMGFALLREPSHSDEDIARAKRWLYANRDVEYLHVYKPCPKRP